MESVFFRAMRCAGVFLLPGIWQNCTKSPADGFCLLLLLLPLWFVHLPAPWTELHTVSNVCPVSLLLGTNSWWRLAAVLLALLRLLRTTFPAGGRSK
jgi:hypothetical protein